MLASGARKDENDSNDEIIIADSLPPITPMILQYIDRCKHAT
jgi:hypothetical protein